MDYEFYIDIFFLINLFVNYIVLGIVKTIMNRKISGKRHLLTSLFGAMGGCIIVLLPVGSALFKQYFLNLLNCLFMLFIFFGKCMLQEYIKGLVVLYMGAALIGGMVLNFCRNGKTLIVLSCVLVAYFIVINIYKIWKNGKQIGDLLFKVILVSGSKEHEITGFYDTGNNLMDPYFSKPVCIIDPSCLGDIIEEYKEKVRYISYNTIVSKNSLMPVFTTEKMIVHINSQNKLSNKQRKKEGRIITIDKPVIGIAPKELSMGNDYQIILNNKIFK